jgi:hypothetical protein
MPVELSANSLDIGVCDWSPYARLKHVAAAWPSGNLSVDVDRDEAAMIENRLRALKGTVCRRLDHHALSERTAVFQFA